MSRIDEALKRAAGHTNAPAIAVEPELDVKELSRESFPLEKTNQPQPDRPHGTRDGVSVHSRRTVPSEKLVNDILMPTVSREQYRRLASTLHHAQDARGLKVVMIASAVQGEGKTLTAVNLALTLSHSYQRRVLLIDADLRRPTLHTMFHVSNSSGLSDLTSSHQAHLVVREVTPHLSLLPGGPPTSDPMAGLTSARMKRVIAEAREDFDWVIVDTPPVVLLTDANLLSAMVDGAVLVIKAGVTPYELVTRAIAALGANRILGVVLNRAEQPSHSGYGYGYYDYNLAPPHDAKKRR